MGEIPSALPSFLPPSPACIIKLTSGCGLLFSEWEIRALFYHRSCGTVVELDPFGLFWVISVGKSQLVGICICQLGLFMLDLLHRSSYIFLEFFVFDAIQGYLHNIGYDNHIIRANEFNISSKLPINILRVYAKRQWKYSWVMSHICIATTRSGRTGICWSWRIQQERPFVLPTSEVSKPYPGCRGNHVCRKETDHATSFLD